MTENGWWLDGRIYEGQIYVREPGEYHNMPNCQSNHHQASITKTQNDNEFQNMAES